MLSVMIKASITSASTFALALSASASCAQPLQGQQTPVPVTPAQNPAPQPAAPPVFDPMAATIAQWNQLRRTENLSFSSYAAFLAANRDWPGEAQIRRNAERAIRPGMESPASVIAFFRQLPPTTPVAWLRYAEALQASGLSAEASSAARNAWTLGALTVDEEARLLNRFSAQLSQDDHDARMDRLLWLRATTAAQRQMAYVSAQRRPNFDVRLALLTKAEDAPDKLAYATARVRADAGFIADYMWWLRNTGQAGVARQILRQNQDMAAYPSAPDVWLQMLLIAVQDSIKSEDWQVAYDIARRAPTAYAPGTNVRERPFAERDSYTDLVWIAATTAYRRLNAPGDAAEMFRLYANAARSPQTQARGWYWAGRAYDAAGRAAEARTAFELAARFVDQFHGQLANERLGRRPIIGPETAKPPLSLAQRTAFHNRSVVRAMLSLGKAGNWIDQSLFVRAIANAVDTDAEHAMAAELAQQADRPDLTVLVGRNARNTGLAGHIRTSFPQVAVPPQLESDWTIIHAITRQESQFDKHATSRVGAKGMMQLMPGTARETAPRAGLVYDQAMLADPLYNMTLGATYFGRLMTQYGGSYVLAVAAYNAGPGNVNRWLRANGDPRVDVDVLEWIEAIPFSETRNYVQRVLENAVVYDMLNPSRAKVRSATPLSTYLGKSYPG